MAKLGGWQQEELFYSVSSGQLLPLAGLGWRGGVALLLAAGHLGWVSDCGLGLGVLLGSGVTWGMLFPRRTPRASLIQYSRLLCACTLAFHWAKRVTGPGSAAIRQESGPSGVLGNAYLLNSNSDHRVSLPVEPGLELWH